MCVCQNVGFRPVMIDLSSKEPTAVSRLDIVGNVCVFWWLTFEAALTTTQLECVNILLLLWFYVVVAAFSSI